MFRNLLLLCLLVNVHSIGPPSDNCENGDFNLFGTIMNSDDSITAVLEICMNNMFSSLCAQNFPFNNSTVQMLANSICSSSGFDYGLFLEPINNQTTSDSSVVLTNLQCSPPFVSFLESCVVDTAQNDTCLDHSMDVVLHCGKTASVSASSMSTTNTFFSDDPLDSSFFFPAVSSTEVMVSSTVIEEMESSSLLIFMSSSFPLFESSVFLSSSLSDIFPEGSTSIIVSPTPTEGFFSSSMVVDIFSSSMVDGMFSSAVSLSIFEEASSPVSMFETVSTIAMTPIFTSVIMSPSPSVEMSPSPSVEMPPSPSVEMSSSPSVEMSSFSLVEMSPSPSVEMSSSSLVEIPSSSLFEESPFPSVIISSSPLVEMSLSSSFTFSPEPPFTFDVSSSVEMSSSPLVEIVSSSLFIIPPSFTFPSPSVEMSSFSLVEMSPSPSVQISPSPSVEMSSVEMSPSPSVEVSPSPSVEMSPSPSVEISPSPSVEVSPSPSIQTSSSSPSLTTFSTVSTTTSSTQSPTPSPTPGVLVLPFLEFLNEDISPIVPLPRSVDSSSEVFTNVPIVIESKLFTRLFVVDNGVISLGNNFRQFYEPVFFPSRIRGIQSANVFAAYWADTDTRVQGLGSVRYQIYTQDQSERLEMINQFVRESQGVNFTGTWALTVEWNKVRSYDQVDFNANPSSFEGETAEFLKSTNTFQATIITNSMETFVIYTYKCGELQWTGPPSGEDQAVIGYNIQGFGSINEPLSGTEFVDNVACTNMPRSPFVNIVYRFIGTNDLSYLQCLNAEIRDQQLFPFAFSFFLFRNQDCPCSLLQAFLDFRYYFSYFNADQGSFCFSLRFSFFSANLLCCYEASSNNFGSLITSGARPSTVIPVHPFFRRQLFIGNELEFNRLCCIEGDFCNIYLSRRPSRTCNFYRPPQRTWFWGDPHISTLDGRRYTFNGLGEYVMTNVNDGLFQLQARTAIAGNSSATIFSAFAAADNGEERVQVERNSDGSSMVIKINGLDITTNLSNIEDTYSGTSVFLTRTNNNTIRGSFSSSVSVDFTLMATALSNTIVVPQEFQGNLTGITGNFDGDDTNDFISRNGTVFSNDISDRQKHVVAQTWQVTEKESLFDYENGQSYLNFTNPDHEPLYLDEIDNETIANAAAVCGSIDNIECIFDFVATGDMSLATSTLQINNENNEDQLIIANFPPVISGPPTYRIDLNETSSYVLNVTDTGDTFSVIVSGVAGTLPPFDFNEGSEEGEYTLSFTLITLQSFTLSIIATDSRNASSSITPQLEICACENNGTCISDGIIDLSANPLIFECLCQPAWTGRFCTEDVDGCLELSCFNNAPCMDVPAPQSGAICPPCPEGYVGNGEKCFDIDECGVDTDNCAQLCINTQGSFECACNQGFQLMADGRTCIDVDECSNNMHDCAHLCQNVIGSFNCSCQLGFLLNVDGRSCNADPERTCPSDNECEQLCGLNITVTGSGAGSGGSEDSSEIVCACLNGFQLGSNRTNCSDINECASNATNPCQQNCTNNEGGFTCSCRDGFNQNGFLCEDINECASPTACRAFQECFNTMGSFECVCQLGYLKNGTTQECYDINECDQSPPCDQNCTNTIGSFSCSCMTGFRLMDDFITCGDINECIGPNPPCPADQLCMNNVGSFMCECPEGMIMNSDGLCIPVVTSTSVMPSMTMVPTSPVPHTPEELQQTVQITVLNIFDLNDDMNERLRNAIANATNSYCNDNPNECNLVDFERSRKRNVDMAVQVLHDLMKRQQMNQITADDVIITDTRQVDNGLIVVFFVRGSNTAVYSAPTIVAALMERIEILEAAGFTVTNILVVNPPPSDDGLSDGEIAGIVIAVIFAVLIIVVLLILLIYCCWRSQRSKGRYAFVEKAHTVKDDFTIKNSSYNAYEIENPPSPIGSVQSMTLNFKNADSSSDDDSTADDVSTGNKPVLDESEETRL